MTDAADFYSGIVVDAYARLKSASFDAQRYADFVLSTGQPSLEIGCGYGQPLLTLAAGGLDVDGLDSSLDMVLRCRAEAERLGLDVSVYHQRVEDLALERRYASMYFAGPTFNLLPEDRTALRALRGLREHLSDEGMALIPLWIPEPTSSEELGTWREAVDDSGGLLRYSPQTETHDPERRTRTTRTRYEKVTASGTESVDRDWIVHWYTPETFRRMCADSGLDVVNFVDDETGEEATETSVEFTATLRRARTMPHS